jgi:hypothetical protein
VYYARAIEAPAPLIHGNDPLRCRYDESGRCVEIDPCGAGAPIDDDCLSEAEPRAWSSPIYVDYERNDPDAARYSPDEVADRPARGQGERDT